MIYLAPQPAQDLELRYRPSYGEIADIESRRRYQTTEAELVESREGSEYVRRVLGRLELSQRMRQLASNSGWESREIERPSTRAIARATEFGETFINFGLVPDAIVPSSEGGVAICFMRNGRYADVEVMNSGEVLAVRYSSNDNPFAWVIQPDAATDATFQIFSQYLSA